MNTCHSNRQSEPRDDMDDVLDNLFLKANQDLQTSLRPVLNVSAGFDAILHPRRINSYVSGFARFRASLVRGERISLWGMYGFIAFLHVIGFGVLLFFVVPKGYNLGSNGIYGVWVGLLAYALGLRHAFDADHIAAIDNTTRKLMSDNALTGNPRKPLSVGLWFSLGHSTIVFLLALLLAAGMKALAGQVENESSELHSVTGIIGLSVSGLFLWILGILNLVILIGIIKVFHEMRTGSYNEQQLEDQLNKRGFMNRILSGLTKSVRRPWHIYPVGVLFGLGFDTATEVALLVLIGGAAAFKLPFYAILVLPILFAAGMCLMDTTDGVVMNAAYGWAFAKPVRKIFYNITITGLSVAVALIIGTIELIGVLVNLAGIRSAPLVWIGSLPLDYSGYGIVALFVLAWLTALAVWRLGRFETKWSDRLAPNPRS